MRSEITQILMDLGRNEIQPEAATGRVFEVVYGELRRLAAGLMQAERTDHTLQPTALVHEAYLRLVDGTRIELQNRAHFFGIAASAMRRILVEHARRRATVKRGGGWERIPLQESIGVPPVSEVDILDLNDALIRLADMDDRLARIVELRFFAGLEIREVAHFLGVSERTVFNDWRVAKMWLAHQLAEGESS